MPVRFNGVLACLRDGVVTQGAEHADSFVDVGRFHSTMQRVAVSVPMELLAGLRLVGVADWGHKALREVLQYLH